MNPPGLTSSPRVCEAVRELRAQTQPATRGKVAELSGLMLTAVGDLLSRQGH